MIVVVHSRDNVHGTRASADIQQRNRDHNQIQLMSQRLRAIVPLLVVFRSIRVQAWAHLQQVTR